MSEDSNQEQEGAWVDHGWKNCHPLIWSKIKDADKKKYLINSEAHINDIEARLIALKSHHEDYVNQSHADEIGYLARISILEEQVAASSRVHLKNVIFIYISID